MSVSHFLVHTFGGPLELDSSGAEVIDPDQLQNILAGMGVSVYHERMMRESSAGPQSSSALLT